MSRDVLAISRLFSSCIFMAARFFIHSGCSSVECRKKALFCGDFCDRNRAIILVIFVLVSLMFMQQSALVSVCDKRRNSKL